MVIKNEDQTYSAQIDQHDYTFSLWSASKGIETLAELSAIAGEFATAVSKVVVDAGGVTGDVSANLLGDAVATLATGLGKNPKATLALVRRLTTDGVLCDNRPIVFDQHFKGRAMHTLQVVRAGLEVQYSDFFSVFQSTKEAPPPKVALAATN